MEIPELESRLAGRSFSDVVTEADDFLASSPPDGKKIHDRNTLRTVLRNYVGYFPSDYQRQLPSRSFREIKRDCNNVYVIIIQTLIKAIKEHGLKV